MWMTAASSLMVSPLSWFQAGDCTRRRPAAATEGPMPDFDRVLVLETAGKVGRTALASDRAVIAEAPLAEERRRASDLALAVDRLFREAGWEPRTLTAVVVGLGPGSYTGLRVGLAPAKAPAEP